MCTTKRYVICGLTSVVFCLGFIILAVYLPGVINSVLVNQVLIQQRWILSNSSQGFSQWQSNFYGGAPPANLYVYAYNVTNPTDVINGAKPLLDQLGPYIYNWDWYLFDVEWSSDDKFVDFFKAEYYVFNRDLTDKALDPIKDHCFFPSLAYAGLRANLGAPGDDHWWQALLVDIIQSAANVNQTIKEQSGPFIYTSVNEFVWGFDSQLLLWINQTFGSLIPNTTINPVVAVQTNDTSQAAVKNRLKQRDQFQTGKADTSKLNQYSKFRGSSNLTIWGNDDANMVRGTDGLGFQVDLQGQPIEVLVDNIYRHVRFVSNQTYDVQGITTNLYFIDVNEFSNDLKQYYLNAPSGVSNITAVNVVTQGSPIPIIVSQPHYFSADPYYADQIEILPPNDVTDLMKHNTFLFVEPHTGLTLKANKRLQVNLQIKPSLLTYPNIKPAFVPVVWFEESSELSADQAAFWQNNVGQAIKWMKNIPVIALCLAGIFLFVSGAVLFQAYLISRPPPHYSPINQ